MSAIAHATHGTWAATHRILLFVLALAVVAIAVPVVLLTRDTTPAAPSPALPVVDDTCQGAAAGTAC
jgi:hypothetical protein